MPTEPSAESRQVRRFHARKGPRASDVSQLTPAERLEALMNAATRALANQEKING